jgi:hypothetical protein
LFDKIGRTWLLKEIFSPLAWAAAAGLFVSGVETLVEILSDAEGLVAACTGAFLQEAKHPVSTIKRMIKEFMLCKV